MNLNTNINPRSIFLSIFLEIKNDERLDKDILTKLEINDNKSPTIIVEEKNSKNTCFIQYSHGTNSFKIEHWAGLPNTAFNLGMAPELVLTTYIENKSGFINNIKSTIIKALQYETAYKQWIMNGNDPKITANTFTADGLKNLPETHVLVKELVLEPNKPGIKSYTVVNKRNQTFTFSHAEFHSKFHLNITQ